MTPAELRAAREALGLSQVQLAPLLGYSASSRISEVEAGTTRLGAAALRLLQAYVAGYRPPDWPVPREAKKKTP